MKIPVKLKVVCLFPIRILQSGKPTGLSMGESRECFLYPNPATGLLGISAAPAGPCSVSIANLQGACILKQESFRPDTDRLDISNLPPGYYILHLDNGKSMESLSFVRGD